MDQLDSGTASDMVLWLGYMQPLRQAATFGDDQIWLPYGSYSIASRLLRCTSSAVRAEGAAKKVLRRCRAYRTFPAGGGGRRNSNGVSVRLAFLLLCILIWIR